MTEQELIARIDALRAENAEKDKEIERLKKCRHECKIDCLLEEYNCVCEKMARVEAERDAAIYDLHKLCPAWKWDGSQGEA